jgi:two-component system phosphate regulon sensor histidine kinase PhoR
MTNRQKTANNLPEKLSSFDRIMITLLGLTVILGLGAVGNIPFLSALAAGLVYTGAVQIYGRLKRARDLPINTKGSGGEDSLLFDQRAIADSLSEAVWIVSPQEKIIYANAASKTLFRENRAGRRLATVMREPAVRALVKTVLNGEIAEPADYQIDVPIRRAFRVNAAPIDVEREDEPPRRYAILVFYDVTDLVKFAATQGDFLANASHELKTPIASLLGYIETLRGHAKNDAKAREKFLGIMQEQAERMQRLISDLLSLRQIEQSEHIAPGGAADLRAAAEFAIDTVTPLARARGVKISLSAPKATKVIGAQDELVQLALNILDNGVKMSPRGARIEIEITDAPSWQVSEFIGPSLGSGHSKRQIVAPLSAPQGYAFLKITDQGPGFAASHIPRIGERFYRIAGDRRAKDKGTGLGLAIVKHITLRHRGGLLVESRTAAKDELIRAADPDNGERRGPKKSLTPANEAAENLALVKTAPTGTSFTAILPLKPAK